ncbi:hypothetical protein [Oceaniradius stylonematis]|uniref:hypothetical protein n=1 Tax=Oceaniradius stylonematis TaxID=2184161 RepID=UPI00273E0936|nr:hypothetical protein [Oceaniradius stylonematis]
MAEAGHNSDLTDKERMALLMDHVDKLDQHDKTVMAPLQAQMKDAKAEERRLRGVAKSEGFKLAVVDEALRIKNIDDVEIIRGEIEDRARIYSHMTGDQMDLFPDRTPLVEKAKAEGVAAGWNGKECKSPYGPGSDADQAWIAGWHEGQTERREAFQSAMEKKKAAEDDPFPDPDDEDDPDGDEDDTGDEKPVMETVTDEPRENVVPMNAAE